MIDLVVKRALSRAIEALPKNALGIRCHALPVDEHLEECLDGIRELLSEQGHEDVRFVIGSASALASALPPRTVVLPSDLAAAEATRLRNEPTETSAPNFKLVYLNAGSTPGEAGLADVLIEVRAQTLARHFAETTGLSLLAAVGLSRARPIVARLEDTTVEALARFDAIAQVAGEKTALPTLGFLPRSLEADDAERPNAQWVSDFDTITSGKLIEPLRVGVEKLEKLTPAERERFTKAILNIPGMLPAAVRASPDLVAALVKLATAVRRFALGQDMDPAKLCGLSRRLLDLLRSEKMIAALSTDAGEPEPGDEDDDPDGPDDREKVPPNDTMREEEILARFGAGGLKGAFEHFEFEDGALDISLRNTGKELISLETDLPHPVTALTVKDAAPEVAEGVCFAVTPESAILAGINPATFTVRFKRAPGSSVNAELQAAIETFCARRSDLLKAIEVLLPPEEAPKLTKSQRALLALEVIPLTCVANARTAADAYVSTYVELMKCAFNAALEDGVEKWITHLDLAVSLDTRQDTLAARLQPLHPLRIARAQLWLESRSEPPLFPSSVVTLTGYTPTALHPQGERYCYHARPRSGPSSDGVEAAVEDGLNATWSLLAPKVLMAALDVELVDVVNASAAVTALYHTAINRFAEDAGVGPGVHLRIRCAYSQDRGPTALVCPQVADLPELAGAVGVPPGIGVTVEVMPEPVQMGSDAVHLSVQAVEAPFHGLQPSEHAIGWSSRYIPGGSGNVIAVELTGSPALNGYRLLLRHYQRDTTATFDPGATQPSVGTALVKTFVAYGGWPVRPNPESSLLSYNVIGRHVIATLIDGALFDAEVTQRLTEFSAGGAAAIGNLSELRKGILGLFPCRNFLADLIGGVGANHTLGWLGILRAYRDARLSAGDAETLTLSLDSPEGRSWIKSTATALGVDESRADLLILEGHPDTGVAERIRVIELKARTSAKVLGSKNARAKLARQALITAARLRIALERTDDRAKELRDGLRKLLWLGAGQQQAALLWQSVLEKIDSALFANAPLSLPVMTECWLVPEEDWYGVSDESEEVASLDVSGEQIPAENELVRFRVLQAVSRREAANESPHSAPPAHTSPVSEKEVESLRAAPDEKPPQSLEVEVNRLATVGEQPKVVATPSASPPSSPSQASPPPPSPIDLSLVAPDQSPPADGMKIVFGCSTRGEQAIWLPNRTDLVNHFNVGITGSMGSGKTQFTKSLLAQIVRAGRHNPGGRRPGLLVFDYKGDYVDLVEGGFAHAVGARVLQPHELPINPLRLKQPDSPLDLKLSMRQFAETIRTIARATGDVQRQKVIMAIEACLAAAGIGVNDKSTWNRPFPTMKDLDDYVTSSNAVEGVPYSVIHDLADLCIFAPEDPGADLDAFFDEITVIDLRPLAGADKTIAAVISFFMNAFFARMIQQGESRREDRVTESGGKVDVRQIRRLLLVDEADDFISLDLPSLKNVMQQGRAFGYGVILSTQFLHHFDSANSPLKPLVGTWILHGMANVTPTVLRNLFGLSNDEAKALATTLNGLEKHHSICHGLSNDSFRRRLTPIRDLPFFELQSLGNEGPL